MKKTIVIALVTLAAMFCAPQTANKAEAQYIWTCRAVSPVAIGIGRHYVEDIAAQRAMAECAIRTPFGMVCILDSCL